MKVKLRITSVEAADWMIVGQPRGLRISAGVPGCGATLEVTIPYRAGIEVGGEIEMEYTFGG